MTPRCVQFRSESPNQPDCVGTIVDLELTDDRGQMGPDCDVGHIEAFTNFGRVVAFAQELENLPFPRREPYTVGKPFLESLAKPTSPKFVDELLHQGSREHSLTGQHDSKGFW